MHYKEKYHAWLIDPSIDQSTKEKLLAISEEDKEIEDRFYQELQFGTAGLRGKLGAGSNRMNQYTVAKATEGFARMIENHGKKAKDKGVAIAYDVRHFSKKFAELTACVFAGHGIRVFLHKEIQPTPLLSYTVRELGTFAGVMITASHNPKEYNGYKAYNSQGSQILDHWAKEIMKEIEAVESFAEIKKIDFQQGLDKGVISYVDDKVIQSYVEKVLNLSINDDLDYHFPFVYSPLNGTGRKLVEKVFHLRNFKGLHMVEEQVDQDPDFTTVGYPNPEDPKAFRLAEALGKKVGAKLLLATDPDADRVAMEFIGKDGEYVFINGNQAGILLTHYLVTQLHEKALLPKNGAIIKSIVTGDFSKAIADKYGIKVFDVLTGFKNIAGLINEWDLGKEYEMIFSYEESIGYNRGIFVRDKDAVSTSMLLVEMASFYAKKGVDLLELLDSIYEEYGYYSEKVISYVLEGLDGKARMERMMEDFRKDPLMALGSNKLIDTIDYLHDNTGLSKSNVLKYIYEGDSWFAIRPSGTEPKIKLYLYTVASSREESERKLEEMENLALGKMDQVK